MKVISFDSKICQNLDQSLAKEWIETNQFGGYASSTIASINTRRSHGLFVPQLKPPLDHHVLLSHVEEILYIDEVAYPLSSQLYSETIYPEGYRNIHEFTLQPFPTWTYYIEDLVLTKSIIFMHDEQTVIIRYQLLEGDPNFVRLEIKPLTPFRSIHSLTQMNDRLNTQIDVSVAGRVGFAGLYFHHNAVILDQSGGWYQNIYYPEEKDRGLDFQEDLYHPFQLVFTFLNEDDPYFCASLQDRKTVDAVALIAREENRRSRILKDIRVNDPRFQLLAYSSHKFLMDRPWLGNSPREVLLALHGFAFSTGQHQIARDILLSYGDQILSNTSEADTPLLFIHCVYEYFKYSHDLQTLDRLFPAINSIIERYVKGTHPYIRMTEDGLIEAVDRGKALTWMNAVTSSNIPITAREGKPVELQALWYQALCVAAEFSEALGKSSYKKGTDYSLSPFYYEQIASTAKRSFNHLFWNSNLGYLYDVVSEKKKDASLRPNQLFALSLPFPILEDNLSKWRSILDIIKQNLLTPFGLRSLAPTDSYYQKVCRGDRTKRSRALHQGSVWPWLLVPYFQAVLRISTDPEEDKAHLIEWVLPLLTQAEHRGLGFISEVFDGDFPHEAREAVAHSINVAACLELYETLVLSAAPIKIYPPNYKAS